MTYKVTYAIDSLDPAPTVMTFDSESEAIEWLSDEIDSRVQWQVDHSPYMVSESDLDEMREIEASLARIERV